MVHVGLKRGALAVATLLNWGTWLLMFLLIGSQFLGIVWDTTTSVSTIVIGTDPHSPPKPLLGFNDEPYTDRAVACLPQGRSMLPVQLSTVLSDPKLASVVDMTGTAVHAFRVVNRTKTMKLAPQTAEIYAQACGQIDLTLNAIQDSCVKLGFNVTRDSLRIVQGLYGNETVEIRKALPILLLPFFDNGANLAYIIPAWDGSACIMRLHGTYQSAANTFAVVKAVPRDVREAKVVEWLGNPGGAWRNGWYEAPDGQRWYANMITSSNDGPYGMQLRVFDTLANKELDCESFRSLSSCKNHVLIERWGRQIATATETKRYDQVFATNGSRVGLFVYSGTFVSRVTNPYTLEMFISNTSVFVILVRWFISLGAMAYSYYTGVAAWQTTGLGALSSSRTFNLFPIVLLPKLKLTLCAFFTVGCSFEGQQLAFSGAWYVIYPAIVDFLLYYYSLLNTIAKLTYRRMSDVLFGPTLLSLCALHCFRMELAAWDVLHLNGRISTQILSDEVDALRLSDFFSSDVAMRLNGNAKPIFYFKMGVLALSFLPLLFSENMTSMRGKKYRAFSPCGIEQSLAIRASNLGGLGRSAVYVNVTRGPRSSMKITDAKSDGVAQPTPCRRTTLSRIAVVPIKISLRSRRKTEPAATSEAHHAMCTLRESSTHAAAGNHALIGYEMSRLGFLVFGGRFLISYDDWYIVTSLAPLRLFEKLWNYRITVFEVARTDCGAYQVVGCPRVCRVDDPQLLVVPFYEITVGAFL